MGRRAERVVLRGGARVLRLDLREGALAGFAGEAGVRASRLAGGLVGE